MRVVIGIRGTVQLNRWPTKGSDIVTSYLYQFISTNPLPNLYTDLGQYTINDSATVSGLWIKILRKIIKIKCLLIWIICTSVLYNLTFKILSWSITSLCCNLFLYLFWWMYKSRVKMQNGKKEVNITISNAILGY